MRARARRPVLPGRPLSAIISRGSPGNRRRRPRRPPRCACGVDRRLAAHRALQPEAVARGSLLAHPLRNGHTLQPAPMLKFRNVIVRTSRRHPIRRALDRVAARQRPAGRAAQHRRRTAQARRAHGAPHARRARGGVRRRHPCERARAEPDDAIRRAREPLVQDRGPALACAARARAGIRSSVTRRSPARSPIPCPAASGRPCCRSLIARQIVHLGRDAKLRLYRCERWSAAKWTELFTPFTRACALRIEREPLRLDAMGGPTTIERQFLMILVLKLADPGNLAPRQIEWIAAQLEEWCQPLRLTLKPVVGHVVLRRSRRQHGIAAPLAGAARRPRAVRRPAAPARADAAEPGRAGGGGAKRAPHEQEVAAP